MWLSPEDHIWSWVGADDFPKEGGEMQIAESEREAQISVMLPEINIRSGMIQEGASLFGGGREQIFVESNCGYCLTRHLMRVMAEVLKGHRDVPLLQLMALPLVFETGTNTADSYPQPPRSPSAPVINDHPESSNSSSDGRVTRDTEVLLLGLKSDTQYNATVYCRAEGGTEGQPQTIKFKTSMLTFVKWL